MRDLFFLIMPILMFVSCKGSETKDPEPIDKDSIYGKWQLVEIWGGATSGSTYVEDGYFYTFNSDSTCSTNYFVLCKTDEELLVGTYGLYEDEEGKIMKMRIECEDRQDGIIPNSLFRYKMDNGFLKLTPHESVNTCDEGCYRRFEKVANEEK